jgi:hypothetical protein
MNRNWLASSANVHIAETTGSVDCETLATRGRFINYVESTVNRAYCPVARSPSIYHLCLRK